MNKAKYILSSIWLTTGTLNASVVFPINLYNSFAEYDRPDSKPNHVLGHFILKGAMPIAIGLSYFSATSLKSAAYFGLGPIGTWRLGLAIANLQWSGDPKWLDPVFRIGTCWERGYLDYSVGPLGDASWIPIKQ